LQADHIRHERDPLVGQGRISSLREAAEPFFIPRIEPVMSVVRSKQHVEIGVERACRKLHQQQRPMNRQRYQNDCKKRNWTRVTTLDGAHNCALLESTAKTLDSKTLRGVYCIFRLFRAPFPWAKQP